MASIKVAMDGPAGAGKSSVARAVAQRLGFLYVDTGAMYRAIALFAQEYPDDAAFLAALMAGKCSLSLGYVDGEQHVYLNDEDVSGKIRTPEIAMGASHVSAMPEVRGFLLDQQRELAAKNNVIMDGRDIGTVVLPDAQVKIYLTASARERARRRYAELEDKDVNTFDAVLQGIIERDENDKNRAIAPLRQAQDAVYLDTTGIDFEKVCDNVIALVKKTMDA